MKTVTEWHGRYLDGGITIPDLIAEVQRDAISGTSERYCNALRSWARVSVDAGQLDRRAAEMVRLTLSKSCLAHRLIYGGEQLRVHACPIHHGTWSGCVWTEVCPGGCNYGANLTGWIENGFAAGCLLGFGWAFWLALAFGMNVPTAPRPDYARLMVDRRLAPKVTP